MKKVFLFIFLLVCLTSGSGNDKQKGYISQLFDSFIERNKAIIQGGKEIMTLNEKAITEAFNQVIEDEEKRKEFIPVNRDNGEKSNGFFYGFATVMNTLPKIKAYFSPKKTHEDIVAKVKREADLDAFHTARVIRIGQEAREAGIRKVLESRARKQQQLQEQQQKQQSGSILRDKNDNETVCHFGREEKVSSLINTCSTRRECRISKIQSSGLETLDSPSIVFVDNHDVNITEITCNKLPVNFEDDYNASNCHVTAINCSDDTPIRDCPVEIICYDPIVVFGLDGRYGFRGSNDVIYCNGVAVDDPTEYSNKTLPDECEVKTLPGSVNGTCYTINATDLVTVLPIPCVLSCLSTISQLQCVCPDDYTGVNCEEQQNITCTGYLVSPLPKCVTGAKDNLLVYDRPCLVYDNLERKRIQTNWNISCKFSSLTLRNRTGDDGFKYWLNTPDLKLSKEPDWVVGMEAFQFSSFISPISISDTKQMKHDNIVGKEVMSFSITPDDKHIVGGRVYVELGFDSNHTPAGIKNRVLRRFFLDDSKGGYDGGQGEARHYKEGLGKGEIAIIIIASIVVFAIIVGAIRLIYERRKEEKVADAEANSNTKKNNNKKKSKKD